MTTRPQPGPCGCTPSQFCAQHWQVLSGAQRAEWRKATTAGHPQQPAAAANPPRGSRGTGRGRGSGGPQ
jgi:hypothetical protein